VQEQIAMIVGIPEVDCFVDCVGFEASGHGADGEKASCCFKAMAITRAGGSIGIGLYVTEDPELRMKHQNKGALKSVLIRLGKIPFFSQDKHQ
jgi:glutathione-independent formaldehyde dehydrogenase